MKKCHVFWVILLVSILVASFSFPAWGAKTIKIGVIGPMKFVQGVGQWNGATLAAEQINARGGVKVGNKMMQIELVQADSNEFLNVTDATNAMERLVTQEGVNFVVGGFRSEAVLAMEDIAMDHKVIFIDCGAAHPELCTRVAKDYDRYKYFFRGTPFNSNFLARTAFIHMDFVADILKKELKIPKIKVAVVMEKAMWADAFAKTAEAVITQKGMVLVGTWRPSPVATDVTPELAAIQRAGANIIFTVFSSSVGIPFARQAGELKIPAVQVGINVEAQKDSFMQATQGKGDYVMTSNTYVQGVEQNELTKPFVDAYVKRFGETPTYTSDTYAAIIYGLVPSIEEAGTLKPDKIVSILENRVYKTPSGTVKYMKDPDGKPLHDLTWGPGYLTGLATQWQNGKLVAVWPPAHWKLTPDSPEVNYKGIKPYKIPPWVIKKYKKK
jgi:branched-chain amino acid transport system substrate-binding protein